MDGDATFRFPTNISLFPGETVVIVAFKAELSYETHLFRAKYRVPANTRIFGPYSRGLANGDGNVVLLAPEAPEPPGRPAAGTVAYVAVDKIKYYDNNQRSYWPAEPDGRGFSLARRNPENYANDVANWRAEPPSPGRQRIEIQPLAGSASMLAANVAEIEFYGWAGSSYRVERSSDLSNWWTVAELPMRTTSGPRYVTDEVAGGSRFYRVVSPAR
jgi:hypothetical protein